MFQEGDNVVVPASLFSFRLDLLPSNTLAPVIVVLGYKAGGERRLISMVIRAVQCNVGFLSPLDC
jgi:hypothetical protein